MLPSVLFIACIAFATAAQNKVFLPNPCGKYHVGKTQHVLNHTTFNDDPLAPKVTNRTETFIVVTILYPTKQAPTPQTVLKYMDHELASQIEKGWAIPSGELQKLWTSLQWQAQELRGQRKESLPTLLFSPGAGMPCSSSTIIQANMASQGYTVLCIDHPGEPPYLKLPYSDGGIYGIPIDYDWADMDVLYRVNEDRKADYDTLLNLFPTFAHQLDMHLNAELYVHFGFSMGGSVGTDIVARHASVLGGVNYDGAFVDSMFGHTLDVKKPFLMFRDDQNRTGDLSWPWFQGNQSGWWEHLLVKGSHHLDFSDVGLWWSC